MSVIINLNSLIKSKKDELSICELWQEKRDPGSTALTTREGKKAAQGIEKTRALCHHYPALLARISR